MAIKYNRQYKVPESFENISDGTDYFQNPDGSVTSGPSGGGGGGGGSSTSNPVVITNTPGTALSNKILFANISSNIKNASIFINGENHFKATDAKVKLILSDVLLNGAKEITIKKDGYDTVESYIISAIKNPDYTGDDLGGDDTFTGRGLPTMNNNEPLYSSTSYYLINVKKYTNGNEEPIANDGDSVDLSFTLQSTGTQETTTEAPASLHTVSINLEGPDNSVSILKNNNTEIKLKNGNNSIAAEIGTKFSIATSDLKLFRVKTITLTSADESKTINADGVDESIATTINLDRDYNLNVVSENHIITEKVGPTISFINNEKREYNINSKSDIPIGISMNGGVTKLRVSIASKEYVFKPEANSNQYVIVLSPNVFPSISNYRIVIVPSNAEGDGNAIETTINVVDAVWVGVPDLRNIQYPSILRGPDYIGTDVDFTISYESVNTDYVKIYKTGGTNFIKAIASGVVKLNVKKLLDESGTTTAEDSDKITIILKLVPYNEQGKEVITGKEEFITILFDKGDLTIPRDVAISRIADGFISQFDSTIFEDETSKYLTHLLHIGGDNKVITTWVGDRSSLILKLYEPLDVAIQPNQQVWISKLQSNAIIETISISGIDESFCHPLKGPNFSLEPDNGIAYQVFDDLIASGSVTSTDLINRYLESSGIDTSVLNIQYVSGSTYVFENFANFSSVEERVNNFFYKMQLIETNKAKYESLSALTFIPPYGGYDGGILTQDGYQQITEDGIFDIQWEVAQSSGVSQAGEAKKVFDVLNELLRGLDGFEKFLYKSTNNLAYPKTIEAHPITGLTYYKLRETTHAITIAWYESLVQLGAEYDKYNPNYLVNNIPEFIKDDYNNNDFIVFLDMIGQHFDILWVYINNLSNIKVLEEKQTKGFSNKLVHSILESFGWDAKRAFNSELLWEYAFGTYKDGFQKYSMPLEEANNQVWRRILNNLPYLLKHKGTGRAMKAIMACYGIPQSMLTIMEFGGPQDPVRGGSSQFTFDDRTASIFLTGSILNEKGSSNLKIPWKPTYTTDYPNCVEFRIQPSKLPNTSYTLISGSEWSLDLVQTTGSFGKLELNFGGDQSTSTYFEVTSSGNEYITSSIEYVLGPDWKTGSLDFPISTEHYSNIAINRHNNPDSSSWFEVWLATSNGSRIITSVSMSIATVDTQWETGSFLQIGGNGYEGNLDEFRLWTVPLQRSKFQNHTLFPDAINGNSYTGSTEDLIFRLDFEYPKNRTITENIGIKNVSINTSYSENYGYANNMYSASNYPYQYTPYDRTVTATVPSLGFTFSNKIRNEEQTLTGHLSHKVRATQKAFDRTAIDSNRLGLFFSPIKELNMDILKAFGDFNIDNYIGDFGDDYKDHYSELDTLRHYYFERLGNRDIYEYIRLIKYIDKSLFEVLADLAPARANVTKGLLIEPHFLERSKTRWDKPIGERGDYESFINYQENFELESESIGEETQIDANKNTDLVGELNNFETTIDSAEVYEFSGNNANYETKIDTFEVYTLDGTAPFYDTSIQCPTGSSLSGEADSYTFTEIGMDKNSLSNKGFGLYAQRGNGIVTKYDGLFGNNETTGSRKSIFLVKEQYTKKISTQVSGYPVNGAQPGDQVRYENVKVTKYKYKVSVLPFSGSISIGNNIVEVTPLNGYFKTHYIYTNNLSEGLQNSYFNGSLQTALTTPDGLDPVETFTTNPNILRVAKTGRGSGEPILEVD